MKCVACLYIQTYLTKILQINNFSCVIQSIRAIMKIGPNYFSLYIYRVSLECLEPLLSKL